MPERQNPDWRWIGRVAFDEAVALQDAHAAEVHQGGRGRIFLCEHDPVITLGRSTNPAHLLLTEAQLAAKGVAVRPAQRGGSVTYHGPGQLVAYPVVKLQRGVVHHMESLASAVCRWLKDFGISSYWRREAPGIWVDSVVQRAANEPRQPLKICAMGIHVSRRVTSHGLALNLSPDMDAFAVMNPCGFAPELVTSVAQRLGDAPTPEAAAPHLGALLCEKLSLYSDQNPCENEHYGAKS